MTDANRKLITDRLAALVAGPFLLGRRALNLEWVDAPGGPPEPPTEALGHITVTPPEHAIKRHG